MYTMYVYLYIKTTFIIILVQKKIKKLKSIKVLKDCFTRTNYLTKTNYILDFMLINSIAIND